MQLKDFDSQLTSKGVLKTRNRVLFSAIDSTNGVGKRIASLYQRNGDELPPTVLVALEQTGGRGRLGNSWFSPPGGIYVSIILPNWEQAALATLPMRVATTLCRELDSVLDATCRVKWPNDLMVNGKKVGGILIETVGRTGSVAAVVGFGINYSADIPELAATATTVLRETADAPPLAEVAASLIQALETEMQHRPSTTKVVAEYSCWSSHDVDQEIRCRTTMGIHTGRFKGFDERGFLRLSTAAGEQLIPAGEVIEGAGAGHHES